MSDYYLYINNEQAGPYTGDEIRAFLEQQQITPEAYIWKEGLETWTLIADLDEFKVPITPVEMEAVPVEVIKPMVINYEKSTDKKPDKAHSVNFLPIITFLIVGAVVTAWYLLEYRGLPVPENAYRHENLKFAVSPPEGWVSLTPENYAENAALVKDHLPATFSAAMEQNKIAVGFIKPDLPAGSRQGRVPSFGANINIMSEKIQLPKINAREKQEAMNAFTKELSAAFTDFSIESSEIEKIDNLNSLKITYLGTLKIIITPAVLRSNPAPPQMTYGFNGPRFKNLPPIVLQEEVSASIRLKCQQTVIPGANRFYLITAMSTADDFATYETIYNDFRKSFRVLERPKPWHYWKVSKGSVIFRDAMKGAAIGLLIAFLGWAFRQNK